MPGPANATWTNATIAGILTLHACPARVWGTAPSRTAKSRSAPCLPSIPASSYPNPRRCVSPCPRRKAASNPAAPRHQYRPSKLAGRHLPIMIPRGKPTDQVLRAKFARILTAIDRSWDRKVGQRTCDARAPENVRCPACGRGDVTRSGHDDMQPCRQRCRCKACVGRFDDLSGTVLAGHHRPLRVWVLCPYLMGLNLTNRQIALELGLGASDTQAMNGALHCGLAAKAPAVTLKAQVEINEVYVVAVHKGQPAAVAERDSSDGAAGRQAHRATARWRRTSRPPLV